MLDRNDVMVIRELEGTLAKLLEEADQIHDRIRARLSTDEDHERLQEIEFRVQDIEVQIDTISTFDEDLDGF